MEPASVSETEDRRQVEWKHDGARYRGQLRPQTRDDGVYGLRSSGSLFIGLQSNDKEGLVRRSHIVDKIEADHRQDALNAGNWSNDVLDLRNQLLGAVDRSALRQPHRGKECALILSRQEALRDDPEQPERAAATPTVTTKPSTETRTRRGR